MLVTLGNWGEVASQVCAKEARKQAFRERLPGLIGLVLTVLVSWLVPGSRALSKSPRLCPRTSICFMALRANLYCNGQIVGQPRKRKCRQMSEKCRKNVRKLSENCPEGLKTQFSDIYWTTFAYLVDALSNARPLQNSWMCCPQLPPQNVGALPV